MGSCSSGTNITTSGNTNSFFSKDLLRALAIVGLILILLVGTAEGKRGTRATKTTTASANTANFAAARSSAAAGKFKRTDEKAVVGSQKLVHDPKLDGINYMSKRRVPNGPDPIHNSNKDNALCNLRAGKFGRPPGSR